MHIPAQNILVVFLMMASVRAYSGEGIQITAGAPLPYEMNAGNNFFDADSNYYYLLTLSNEREIEFNTGHDAFIVVFGKDLNPCDRIMLKRNHPGKLKHLEPVRFYKTNSGFLILCKEYFSATSKLKARFLVIDGSGHVEMKEAGEINDVSASVKNFHFFDCIKTTRGNNTSYLFSVTTDPSLNVPERIDFLIFDETFQLTGERLISFPDDGLDYDFSELYPGHGGVVFFTLTVSTPYLPDEVAHRLIVYDVFTDQHKSWEFNFDNGSIAKAGLFDAGKNLMGYMGYYTRDKNTDKPAGIFYYVFNKFGGDLIRHKIYDFGEKELKRLNRKNIPSKSPAEDLTPRALHVSGENDVIAVFEYFHKEIMIIRDQKGNIYPKDTYKANEIVIVDFDENDAFVNMGMIPKRQFVYAVEDHLGFISFANKDHLFLIYNDHPKNMNTTDGHKLKTMKAHFAPVVVDYNLSKAEYRKKQLEFNGSSCVCDPEGMIRQPDGTMLFLNKSAENRLIRISF